MSKTECMLVSYWYAQSLFTDAGEVPLEQILNNCVRQRDELLEIKKLSERQSMMLKKLRETVASGETFYCCSSAVLF